MPHQSTATLEDGIRRIIRRLPSERGKHTLRCSIDGTASGISTAFIDALDRLDQSGRSSERLHVLIAQLGDAVARGRGSEVHRVDICIEGHEISFHYPECESQNRA